jgi:hypothetical protein
VLTKVASIRFPPDEMRRIDKAAAHLEIERSDLIRICVKRVLTDHGMWNLQGPWKSGTNPNKAQERPLKVTVDELKGIDSE